MPSLPSSGPRSRAPHSHDQRDYVSPSSSSSSSGVSGSRSGRRGADGRDAGGEAVAAEQVQVAVLERGQARDVLVPDLVALGTELGDGGVDVLRRPEHDGVEDQAERAELVLHPVAVRLVDGARRRRAAPSPTAAGRTRDRICSRWPTSPRIVPSANPAEARASTNPASTSVSNCSSSSAVVGGRTSRSSRTTASANPSPLTFSPVVNRSDTVRTLQKSRSYVSPRTTAGERTNPLATRLKTQRGSEQPTGCRTHAGGPGSHHLRRPEASPDPGQGTASGPAPRPGRPALRSYTISVPC